MQGQNIVGLRAQILENWRYAHPHGSEVVIVTSLNNLNNRYEAITCNAMITEDPSQGGDLLVKTSACPSYESALLELLATTSEMVSEATVGKTAKTAAQRKEKAVRDAVDKRDLEERMQCVRSAIDHAWEQLKPAGGPVDFPIRTGRLSDQVGYNVSAVRVGLYGTGETEELALIDLKGKMGSWIMALEWKKQADAKVQSAILQ
ncbi:hypothetical protein D6C89_07761 [Aureobasidium pullulans]|nr:hypothetical protein D6C89_07761 [Aureobasidium pullulans]